MMSAALQDRGKFVGPLLCKLMLNIKYSTTSIYQQAFVCDLASLKAITLPQVLL